MSFLEPSSTQIGHKESVKDTARVLGRMYDGIQYRGSAHELVEVIECLRAGRTESAVMPLADTLAVQDVLGQAAEQLGVRHFEAVGVL